MRQTTNIGTVTTGAETEGHGLGRYLGRHLRFLSMTLVALAFFGVLSVSAPREALAAGSGWYWTTHYGQNFECYWFYYGTDAYGNPVWKEDGCKVYYGGYHYYKEWSTGNVYMAVNGEWVLQRIHWAESPSSVSNYSFQINGYTNTLDDYKYNTAGIDYFMAGFANALAGIQTRPDALRSGMDTEASGPGPKAPTVSGAPEAGSEAPQGPDVSGAVSSRSVASTEFPWRVCQDDNSKCMRYGGKAWKQVSTSKAQGGTYRVSSSRTSGAFFSAAGATDAGGRTMKLITNTGPKMGKARVLVVNLATARVVKQVTFDLRTSERRFKVAKSITGLESHRPYGLVVLSANGKPVAVDSVGYEAHGNMCHNVV